MIQRPELIYYDRREDRPKKELVYAGRFLDWSYNSSAGRWATDTLFNRRWFSSLYGWLQRQAWSRRKIKPFIRKFHIDVDELTKPIEEYSSFSEFFIREINLAKRPKPTWPDVCAAPAEGRALAYPVVEPEMTFRIKRNLFNLQHFIGSPRLADQFAQASMVIIRLSLADYHHFHFPDSGIPAQSLEISGKYHAGGSYSRRRFVPFYTENYRMITPFLSDHFGMMLLAEVGALTIGSIQQRFRPGQRVSSGDRKGFFELGGSTVVILFQKGRIELDHDLRINTIKGIETFIRLGDSIGRIPQRTSERMIQCHGEN
ncbi:MAG: phosphatidylserine decarboxylase [Acidobacteriota bacterium]